MRQPAGDDTQDELRHCKYEQLRAHLAFQPFKYNLLELLSVAL
jgi:hypothetical protein